MPLPDPSSLPPTGPVPEDALVDWIDGTLSAGEIEKLAQASGRSDIRPRMQQLQRNKALLASLPMEAAPADLHDRVLAALERDALIGVSAEQWAAVEDSSQPVATLPLDRLRSSTNKNRNWWQAAPTMAMAASILLLLGGGLLLYPTIRGALKPAPVLPIGGGLSANNAGNQALGTSSGAGSEASVPVGTQASTQASTPTSASPSSDANALASATTFAGPIDMTRALELAREGKLIVRVLAKDTGDVARSKLARVEATASNPQSRLGWRLTRDVPPSVVAMMMPRPAGEPVMASASLRDRTAELLSSIAGPGAMLNVPSSQALAQQQAQSKVRGTYVLDVPQNSLGFGQALDMLSKGLGGTVVFEQSTEPMQLHREVRPQDVLWWQQPSNQWTDRVAVPLIVQRG